METNRNIIVKKYNIANDTETAGIVSLFNRNGSYQVSHKFNITRADWLLTYKAKEITDFYLVIVNNKVIGCSGFFRYMVRGEASNNCLFSGYLLIDGKERTGQAVRELYQKMWKGVETLPGKVLITEINPQNRASLHLSKLNGYLETADSWEDIYNYHSLFSYMPTLLRSFYTDNSNKFDLSNSTIVDQNINENIITTKIKVDNYYITLKLLVGTFNPFYINIDDDILLFIEHEDGKAYLNYKLENVNCKKINVVSGFIVASRNLERKKTGRIKISSNKAITTKVKIKGNENNFYLLLNRNESNHSAFEMSDIVSNMTETSNKYKGLNICINKDTGDLIYVDDRGNKVFIDKFGEIFTSKNKNFKIKTKHNEILITMQSRKIVIVKKISISNKIKVTYFIKRGATGILKMGLKILRQDYKIFDPIASKYKRFQPKKFPMESDDFLYSRFFKVCERRYFIESINKELIVKSNKKTSNQLGYRPLILDKVIKDNVVSYEYCLKDYPRIKRKVEKVNILNNSNFIISNIFLGKSSSTTCVYKIFENKDVCKSNGEQILLNENSKEYVCHMSKVKQNYWSFNADLQYFTRPKLILKDGTHILLTKNLSKIETCDKVFILDSFRKSLIKIFAPNCWISSFYEKNKIRLRIVGKDNTKIKISI
ncbi:hypothetical protein [Lactobacillus hominis]|uniref:hypothetical protein n=1 Tax=Lactobacillus hominis TaxID=1203033 RepID=UPI0026EF946B|nr:hypothetical protein [Lactobacillus hominis]